MSGRRRSRADNDLQSSRPRRRHRAESWTLTCVGVWRAAPRRRGRLRAPEGDGRPVRARSRRRRLHRAVRRPADRARPRPVEREPVDLELSRTDGCRIPVGRARPAAADPVGVGRVTEQSFRERGLVVGPLSGRSRVVRSTRSIAVLRPSAMARPLVEPVASRAATAGASGRSPTRACSTAAYSPLTRPQAACRSSARDSSVVRPAARA